MPQFRFLPLAMVAALALAACETVPITGRQQINFVDEATEDKLGADAFAQIKAKAPISNDQQANALVARITSRLVRANGLEGNWEIIVIRDKQVNAFALPGGKLAVYEGMLRAAQDEAELASVIGHEIGHVVAHHAAERISRSHLIEAGAGAASIVLGGGTPQGQQSIAALLGAGAAVGLELPFSRSQELEADRIGLILMARAGYDPRQAVEFWQRMQARASAGGGPPEFLSTHPSDESRVARLQELMPEALKEYRPPR